MVQGLSKEKKKACNAKRNKYSLGKTRKREKLNGLANDGNSVTATQKK